jgi:uncharacterized RDD family membrane protein YckC
VTLIAPRSEDLAALMILMGYVGAVLGYQWWAHASGRSLGKRVVGIRALAMETGLAPGFGRGSVRMLVAWLLGLASIILLPLSLIDYLFPLWDHQRQTLHDKAAGTVVVRDAPAVVPVASGQPAPPAGWTAPAYAPAQYGGWNRPRA